MRPNVNTIAVAYALLAMSRVRLDEAKMMRSTDKRKALTMVNESNAIALQAQSLLRR